MKTKALMSLVAALLAALLFTGCTTTLVKKGDLEVSRKSFLNRQTIQELEVDPVTGRFVMKGYSNEQTEIAAAVAGSVAKALAPAVK
jgi:hypothetical protein